VREWSLAAEKNRSLTVAVLARRPVRWEDAVSRLGVTRIDMTNSRHNTGCAGRQGGMSHRGCRGLTVAGVGWLIPLVGLLGGAMIGCEAPAAPAAPSIERMAVSTPEEYDSLWESTCDTLRAFSFSIDRQDRANGVITTYPETTSQGFEVWRPQPEPAYYWAEANLATIRRQATVLLRSMEMPGEYEVEVTVERSRYSLEERQIDNAAGAMRLYSSDAPTVSGRSSRIRDTESWIPLGRDETLERAILAGIRQRGGVPREEASR